jgi:hypothetical protein
MHDNFTFAVTHTHRILTRAAHDHAIAEEPGTLWKFLDAETPMDGETIVEREVPTKASEAVMKAARKKGRAEVLTVRNALREMGSHRQASLRVR